MVKSAKKSTTTSRDSLQNLTIFDNPEIVDCHSVLHNMPPRVTTPGFCAYDGGTTFRVKLIQKRGGRRFSQLCQYHRRWYDATVSATGDRNRSAILVDDVFGLSKGVSYRKAAYRELLYFPYHEQPKVGDVLDWGTYRVVFDCHIADGLLPFRRNHCMAVVIFGWRMFENVVSLVTAYKIVKAQLERLGFEVVEYSIRRVDFNLTTAILPIEKIGVAFLQHCFATRAEKTDWRGNSRGRSETIYIGKAGSSIQFRAYDKTKELKDMKNEYEAHEKTVAIFNRLGLQKVSQISRLEFELSADFFKDSEISTFEELEKRLKSIITYLFRDWLRFLEDNRETYRHKDREKVVNWWNWAREMFENWADDLSTEKVENVRKSHNENAGAHQEALDRAFLMLAASRYKRNHPNQDLVELSKDLAAVISAVELPEWGGAKSKKDLIMNYRLGCSTLTRQQQDARCDAVCDEEFYEELYGETENNEPEEKLSLLSFDR